MGASAPPEKGASFLRSGIRKFSEISFTVYLFQGVFLGIFYEFPRSIGMQPFLSALSPNWQHVIMAVIIVASSAVIYSFVQRPVEGGLLKILQKQGKNS